MINKRDISMARTTLDMERRYQLGQIQNKVDKSSGKGLSSNDFTNDYKEKVDNNTKARHTHNNVSLLNSLNESMIDSWNTSIKYFDLFDGSSTESIELSSIDYDLFIIVFGDNTYIDSKILPYTSKQFCLSFRKNNEVIEEYYTFSEKNIKKIDTTTNVTIFKVIAFKRGVDLNGGN